MLLRGGQNFILYATAYYERSYTLKTSYNLFFPAVRRKNAPIDLSVHIMTMKDNECEYSVSSPTLQERITRLTAAAAA